MSLTRHIAILLLVVCAFIVPVQAAQADNPSTDRAAAQAPRARGSLDFGWRFHQGDPADITADVANYPEMPKLDKLTTHQLKGEKSEARMEALRSDIFATHAGEDVSFVKSDFDDRSWRSVNLPHDWALELPFDSRADYDHGFRAIGDKQFGANNVGWYRRTFAVPAADAGKQFSIELDGAYRNSLVWLNGRILGRNVSGYIGRHFDATPYIKPGADNVLVVRVDASRFEGWFYEGAGIYRHVWLTKTNPIHVAPWGTFVHTTSLSGDTAQVAIETEVNNHGKAATSGATLTSTVYDAEGKAVASVTIPVEIAAGQTFTAKQQVAFKANPWSPKTPYLYKLVTTVHHQNTVADVYETPFGVRTVVMDPNKGVILNGQPIEILGMCNHQDHAGVGVALSDRIQYFRIERLLQMGVNAYRTSHNAPTPELLDACDQLGMLVMDENRRVGADAETLSQLTQLIRRDRNHPSVFIWSLGNEEAEIQGTPAGAGIVRVMQDNVHSLDPSRRCTIAMNHDWGSGFSTVIDVQGFNYFLNDMDAFHAKFPNQPAIGTETDSHVADRGIYANDPKNGFVTSYTVRHKDVPWGAVPEEWWPTFNERPWSSGGFGWTGFDYRGEPTPYVKNYVNTGSHFGTIDQCGFPKADYYYFQANWTLKPVLHLFPLWNWPKSGETINVWAFGNCDAVELFINGASLGRKKLNPRKHLEWNVAYAPGTLKAVGYDASGAEVINDTVVTAGEPAGIRLTPDRATIQADGRDVSMITVEVVDVKGNVVPAASNDITFSVKGGALIGVGNGNPSSHEDDQADHRKVFNGLAQVIVQAPLKPGRVRLSANSPGLKPVEITLVATASAPEPAAPAGVTAVAGNSGVILGWDITPGAATYNILRAEKAGGPFRTIAAGVGGVGLGYVDRTGINGTRYLYAISANGKGTGPRSPEVAVTPVASASRPAR